jgi:carbamoyltransferase
MFLLRVRVVGNTLNKSTTCVRSAMMTILGISAFYHDSAAALIVDGLIVAAAQEERFSRRKHDARFPREAVKYCLDSAGIKPSQVDSVAFYEKPLLKLERLAKTYLSYAPAGYSTFRSAASVWLSRKLFHKKLLCRELQDLDPHQTWRKKLLFSEHHLSHAASAFYPSPFDEALILTIDGVGEWATTSIAHGSGSELRILKELHFPHSLGLLYSTFTDYLGFKVNSGEYKLMGLAPYGRPKYVNRIYDYLIDIKADGSYRLNIDYFGYCVGETMSTEKFVRLFGLPRRHPLQAITQEHMDLAASIQTVLEEVILRMVRSMAAETSIPNLCLAGGVALNCVANGKLLRDGSFRNIWIQPASGDAGGALGAALTAFHRFHGQKRVISRGEDAMRGAYLGPEFRQREIERRLAAIGARFTVLTDEELIMAGAKALAAGSALGWFQGRMEFGPRALGNRSILADARLPGMQRTLNLKVKHRESFRPFAPSVLSERASEYFCLDVPSPYMLYVSDVQHSKRREDVEIAQQPQGLAKLHTPRSEIPAVTHVDYSARVHTVQRDTNPRYHALISSFQRLTGCPVIVNTSFNVRGEPIVCTPEDAFRCFMGTEIEMLAIGNCFLRKDDQDSSQSVDYKSTFELD